MLYLIRPSCLQISNSRSLKKCSIIYHVSVIFNCEIFILSQTPSENMLKRMNGDRCKFPSYCMQTSWTYVHTFPARVGDLHIQISIGFDSITKHQKWHRVARWGVPWPLLSAGHTSYRRQEKQQAVYNNILWHRLIVIKDCLNENKCSNNYLH